MTDADVRLAPLMRAGLRAALAAAAPFAAVLIALPLINLGGGLPAGWWVLAVLFYPFTWILAGRFVAQADRAEESVS